MELAPAALVERRFQLARRAARAQLLEEPLALLDVDPQAQIHRGAADRLRLGPPAHAGVAFVDGDDHAVVEADDAHRVGSGLEGGVEALLDVAGDLRHSLELHPLHLALHEERGNPGAQESRDHDRGDGQVDELHGHQRPRPSQHLERRAEDAVLAAPDETEVAALQRRLEGVEREHGEQHRRERVVGRLPPVEQIEDEDGRPEAGQDCVGRDGGNGRHDGASVIRDTSGSGLL